MEPAMMSYSVDQDHWGSHALDCVNNNTGFEMVTGGVIANNIINKIKDSINRMHLLELFKGIQKVIPAAGVIPLDKLQIIPVMASVGALGGMAGLMSVYSFYGIAHGMELAIEIRAGNLFDPKDDLLVIKLYPAKK